MSATKPFLIGIAGLSGSGKTALARQLAPQLNGGCEIVTLDSYYHPQGHFTLEQRAALNYDHPDSLDWVLLERHLSALHSGHAIQEPVYLFEHHTRAAYTRPVEPRGFLIVEGILTLHTPEVRRQLDLKVFVETRPEECLRRRIDRDIFERGRTRESVLAQYQSTVWPMAQEFVLPSRAFADLVVSGEEPFGQSVSAILARLASVTGGRAMTA